MSVMENLLKDVNRLTQTAAEPQLSFYNCQSCNHGYQAEQMPEVCPKCGKIARQWPGATALEAQSRSVRAAGVAPAPATTMEATHEPSPEPVRVAPDSTPEQPKPKPKAKRTVAKKTEVAPVVEAPASNQPATGAEVDYRAQREARVAAFIEKHGLNEFQPVPVGTATVQTVGYTLWVGGKPIFRFKESFETGREFAADYNAARAEQPATRIDVAACSRVSDPELEACLFKGDLIVSLNSGHGTEQVKVGDVINIGAYRTKENRLRFAII